MNQLSSTDQAKYALVVGVALAGLGAWFWRRHASSGSARDAQPRDVMRWEDEGGNVPAVAVDSGNQGETAEGPVDPDAAATRWEFPRSS